MTIPNSETAVEPKKGLYSGEVKDGKADLRGAILCKTTMPDGTVNNSGC